MIQRQNDVDSGRVDVAKRGVMEGGRVQGVVWLGSAVEHASPPGHHSWEV